MLQNFDYILDKDFDINEEFKITVRHILEKNEFSVTKNLSGSFDFDIKHNGKEGLCDIKFYQSLYTPHNSVLMAAKQLKNLQEIDYRPLLLIVNGIFLESFSSEIFNMLGVQIWDINVLLALVRDYPDLFLSLDFIFTKTEGFSIYELFYDNVIEKEKIIAQYREKVAKAEKIDLERLGEKISKQIKQIKPGRKEYLKYENCCTDLLKYLFKNELALWDKQKVTDDKLNRYDLICRINSTKRFWQDLSKDFNSRYIVFEFKNYKEKIKQGQIYTTEKYLFTTALRSISFIISRNGADSNAIKASKGALKESGKLIICLSDNDLFKMSLAADKGDEPENFVMEIIDRTLVEINR